MVTVLTRAHGCIPMPHGVNDWPSFLRWRMSDDVPDKQKAHYHRGRVWVDLMEELFSHNQVEVALGLTLAGHIQANDLGIYV